MREHDYEKASLWYERAALVHPSFIWQKLANSYSQFDADKACQFLEFRLKKLEPVKTKDPFDSVPNREIREIMRMQNRLMFANHDFDQIDKIV